MTELSPLPRPAVDFGEWYAAPVGGGFEVHRIVSRPDEPHVTTIERARVEPSSLEEAAVCAARLNELRRAR